MKFIGAIFFFALLLISSHSQSQEVTIQNGFITGNTFRAMEETSKNVYVVGLLDGMFLAPLYGAPESKLDNLASCTVGMTGQQLVAIFNKYLANNPERWHSSMHTIGYAAMHEDCNK